VGTVVQKYGGSSVADVEKIAAVAARVKARHAAGDAVVVVVSAMGDTTDDLLKLAQQVAPNPPRRELDMLLTCGERISMALLSMALHEQGVPAISFTGSQSGIITDGNHAQARIVEVRPWRIQDELGRGKVVIVAGYQGVSFKREVTTLGRGGSDTTAVALAAALDAEACEIYSDVDGVFSADPRVAPAARKLSALSYDEMQELATAGAKVLNAQAVEFAKEKGIVISARSTFGGGTGTEVKDLAVAEDNRVKGVTAEADMLALSVRGEAALELLEFLDARAVRARLFSSALLGGDGSTFMLVPLQDVHGLEAGKADLAGRFAGRVGVHEDVGAVTAVGTGLNGSFGAARTAASCAEALGARVYGVFLSPLSLTILVGKAHLKELTRRLHGEFVR